MLLILSVWFLVEVLLVGLTGGLTLFLTKEAALVFGLAESSTFFFGLLSSLNNYFGLVVSIISVCVFAWGSYYMADSQKLSYFFTLLSLFVFSMLVLIMSNSFFSIFLGWEGLGVTSFLLIVFYQNWSSLSGGMLTLLTNRLGDAVLLMSYSYWVTTFPLSLSGSSGAFVILMFLLLSLTKSAQVPFTSWLPAAMAAPTPVSALVHSSTLVTAGVWLLVRFVPVGGCFVLVVGIITLMIASCSALVELDAKKIVALSTLSQLGLLFMSLSLGGKLVCFFHLVVHAFGKASLFMVVGDLIHANFSQQDARLLPSSAKITSVMLMVVSVSSLSGILFFSGFYSKEMILSTQYSILTSGVSFFLIFSVVALTLAYCLVLVAVVTMFSGAKTVDLLEGSASSFLIALLSGFSVCLGSLITSNFFLNQIWLYSVMGTYWSFIFYALFVFSLAYLGSIFLSLGFGSQLLVVQQLSKAAIFSAKRLALLWLSLVETLFLSGSIAAYRILVALSSTLVVVLFSLMAVATF